MSFKSKDLAYNAKQPAFLARIRNQHTGQDADRHERPIARPRGALRTADDDDEDAPTYVLDEEAGNTLSKKEYEDMVAKEKSGAQDKAEEQKDKTEDGNKEDINQEPEKNSTRKKQDVSEAGFAQKKRKAGKILGGDDEDAENAEEDSTKAKPKPMKKAKTKSKTVKLSFGD